MISRDLAERLRAAGVPWSPASGDRFLVPDRGIEEVFTVSEMVIEVQRFASGEHLCFTGTTEWALDSVEREAVVWLPREEQLRELLGEAFVSLVAVPGGFVVTALRDGREERHVDVDAECAYARAVLAVVGEGPVTSG